jgi:hypothetical protein
MCDAADKKNPIVSTHQGPRLKVLILILSAGGDLLYLSLLIRDLQEISLNCGRCFGGLAIDL